MKQKKYQDNNQHLTNEKIRFPEIRVIDEDGSNLGTMTSKAALSIAQDKQLDLVLFGEKVTPPVCKIIDYGKYKYRQEKEKKATRQVKTQLKELKMGYKIEEHDYSVRLKHAKRFLNSGDQVKASIRLRGRENLHTNLARDLLERMAKDLQELGQVQQAPKKQGSTMTMILVPK